MARRRASPAGRFAVAAALGRFGRLHRRWTGGGAEVAPGVVACGGYSGTGNLVGPIAARAAVAWRSTARRRRPTSASSRAADA